MPAAAISQYGIVVSSSPPSPGSIWSGFLSSDIIALYRERQPRSDLQSAYNLMNSSGATMLLSAASQESSIASVSVRLTQPRGPASIVRVSHPPLAPPGNGTSSSIR
jgi:hypothetical protein